MKDVMSLANIYTNNQSCRDRLHKWVWLKPEMYKRDENNENYVIWIVGYICLIFLDKNMYTEKHLIELINDYDYR
jgi:hypothetical protein